MNREHEPTDSRAREAQRAEQAERNRVAAETQVGDLRHVMRDAKGRRFVRRLFDLANLTRSRFSANNSEMSRLEGQADFAIAIHDLAERELPELYLEMVKEKLNDNAGSPKHN